MDFYGFNGLLWTIDEHLMGVPSDTDEDIISVYISQDGNGGWCLMKIYWIE